MSVDFKIQDSVVTTLRELEPDQFFIRVGDFRQRKRLGWSIRQRTTDPFLSKTLYGTTVRTYPSEKVHPCVVLREVSNGGA